jgi:tRNA G46 methylase TrmB
VSTDPRSRTVQAAYDELGPRFDEWMAQIAVEPLARFLGEFVSRLGEGARILEIGCGDGRALWVLAEKTP